MTSEQLRTVKIPHFITTGKVRQKTRYGNIVSVKSIAKNGTFKREYQQTKYDTRRRGTFYVFKDKSVLIKSYKCDKRWLIYEEGLVSGYYQESPYGYLLIEEKTEDDSRILQSKC